MSANTFLYTAIGILALTLSSGNFDLIDAVTVSTFLILWKLEEIRQAILAKHNLFCEDINLFVKKEECKEEE